MLLRRLSFIALPIYALACGEPGGVATTNGPTSGAAGGPTCVPTVEICGNGVDEDCSRGDCDTLTSWAKRFGKEGGFQEVGNVAQMPDGSVLVVGQVDETSDFGAGDAFPPVPIPHYNKPYVVKFKADGTFAWARDAGEGFDGIIWGKMTDVMVVPGSNDVIATGHVGHGDGMAMVWRWYGGGTPMETRFLGGQRSPRKKQLL
jgi:hypothetical protein